MADMNEFKEKLMDLFGTVADKTREYAGIASDKAKEYAGIASDKARDLARIAKLTVEINGEKDTIKKAYIEIGKLYYEMHKDDPDGFFVQLCDEITLAIKSIADKEAEIAALKAGPCDEADVEVEFESVVSEAEDEAPVEEAVEEVVREVEEAEAAVEEAVKEAVDEIEDEVKDE